uniref:Uncharacterized protein n=1 Tax=Megaselia scalaris TaxID=36166 RepID=T1GB71_MEGSC
MWKFRQSQLNDKLEPKGIDDTIISELYTNDDFQPLRYSSTLNMVLISKRLYQSNYYDSRFPIALNFARIGSDIAEIMFKVVDLYAKQYAEDLYHESNSTA